VAVFYTDSHVAFAFSAVLRQRSHTEIRCQELGLKDAPDHEHLVQATRRGAVLITHDRKFYLWDAAWKAWTAEWNIAPTHSGILIIPDAAKLDPIRAADELEHFLSSTSIAHACYILDEHGRWTRA
jgi:hypothetical protein